MQFSKRLSWIAGALTILGLGLLRVLDPYLGVFSVETSPGVYSDSLRAYVNGVMLLAGIFWVGAIDSVRKALEPKPFDAILRFSALAFAASFLVSVVLPGTESSTFTLLALTLYAGPAVFAVRSITRPYTASTKATATAWVLLLAAVLVMLDAVLVQWQPGLWLRVYEVSFVVLWWQTVSSYSKLIDIS